MHAFSMLATGLAAQLQRGFYSSASSQVRLQMSHFSSSSVKPCVQKIREEKLNPKNIVVISALQQLRDFTKTHCVKLLIIIINVLYKSIKHNIVMNKNIFFYIICSI